MLDRSEINRMIAVNRYLVLGTADVHGKPWVSPVFFAPYGDDAFYWVSSPDARHSRDIASRPSVAITTLDSTAPIGVPKGRISTSTRGRPSPSGTGCAICIGVQ
jgi:nitroimidazol reductase NimA-like FMN-containing flavoprotein (pyridoxamine 5'-phosphate oxidase superfamily)